MERKLTHLGERSRACVDLASKDGEPEEGAFKDEVDEGIEGLRRGQALVHVFRGDTKNTHQPNEDVLVLPTSVLWQQGLGRDIRNRSKHHYASQRERRGQREHVCKVRHLSALEEGGSPQFAGMEMMEG
jgi:hypothetical protein